MRGVFRESEDLAFRVREDHAAVHVCGAGHADNRR